MKIPDGENHPCDDSPEPPLGLDAELMDQLEEFVKRGQAAQLAAQAATQPPKPDQ